jgi:hypothetical protein
MTQNVAMIAGTLVNQIRERSAVATEVTDMKFLHKEFQEQAWRLRHEWQHYRAALLNAC